VAEIVEMMRRSMGRTFDEHRQIASGTHAKTHGVVTGRFTVDDDLPPELAFPTQPRGDIRPRRASVPPVRKPLPPTARHTSP